MKNATRKTLQGIERIRGRGHEAVVEVCQSEMTFERLDNFDYFLINTNEFMPLVQKGSVIEVWMEADEWEPTDVLLVTANNRLEIRTHSKNKNLQVLGKITEVKHWPGETVHNYVL